MVEESERERFETELHARIPMLYRPESFEQRTAEDEMAAFQSALSASGD